MAAAGLSWQRSKTKLLRRLVFEACRSHKNAGGPLSPALLWARQDAFDSYAFIQVLDNAATRSHYFRFPLLSVPVNRTTRRLAGLILKGKGFGLAGNLIVGVIGTLLGGFLFTLAGLKIAGSLGAFIAALVGAILLIWLISKIKLK